jgi:hypothetical protein
MFCVSLRGHAYDIGVRLVAAQDRPLWSMASCAYQALGGLFRVLAGPAEKRPTWAGEVER